MKAEFKKWFWSNPINNSLTILTLVGGLYCILSAALGINSLTVAIIGFIILGGGAYQVWTLRRLSEEIDEFSRSNDTLDEIEGKLVDEVTKLENKKRKLKDQIENLNIVVNDLKKTGERLEKELDAFSGLKDNLTKFSAETGKDVRKMLEETDKIFNKMKSMTVQNEKALLSKIAQDLEFIDKDAGMSKYEFERFVERLPEHIQSRIAQMGFTFEKVAGRDGVVDFMEIEGMINKLVKENDEKMKNVN